MRGVLQNKPQKQGPQEQLSGTLAEDAALKCNCDTL